MKKHLLILGAGASMSLVPRHCQFIEDIHSRMPSGNDLVNYISQYHKLLILFIQRVPGSGIAFEEYLRDITGANLSTYSELDLSNESVKKVITTNSYTYQDIKNIIMWDTLNRDSTNKLHYIYLCIASLLVKLHNPISIDYFARNIDFFARDWIRQIQHDDPLCNNHNKAVIKIQEYLKLIVYEYINYKQTRTIDYCSKNNHRDYIKQIIWHLTLLANKENTPIKVFINNHLSIITFNYDTLVEELLDKFQLSKEINHVYGCLKPIEANHHQYLSLEYLCNNNNDNNDTAMNKCLDVSDKSIKWINRQSNTKDKDKYKRLLKAAKNIYFLGFGFDTTNLLNIGLGLNELSALLTGKKIFVSQGNGRIMSILSHVISTHGASTSATGHGLGHIFQKKQGDDKVFINSNYNSNYGCLISMNDINTAFEQDFDLN